MKQHEDARLPEPSHASSSGDDRSDAEGSQLVQPDTHRSGSDLIEVDRPADLGGSEAAVTCSGDAEPTNASQEQQLVEVQRETQEAPLVVPNASSPERIAAADEDGQTGGPVLDACVPDNQTRLHIEAPPPPPPPPPPPQHEISTSGATEDEDFGTPRSEQRERRPQSDEESDQNLAPPECRRDVAEAFKATEAEAADATSSDEDDALLMGKQLSRDSKNSGTAD